MASIAGWPMAGWAAAHGALKSGLRCGGCSATQHRRMGTEMAGGGDR
ncbi:hypothetical protein XCR_0409 [Xanthomonas campestris pv. raphani 756C]|nr:hypothetical protein XCR_0409 [Xanthomonas campestris pv. raphani 756C]